MIIIEHAYWTVLILHEWNKGILWWKWNTKSEPLLSKSCIYSFQFSELQTEISCDTYINQYKTQSPACEAVIWERTHASGYSHMTQNTIESSSVIDYTISSKPHTTLTDHSLTPHEKIWYMLLLGTTVIPFNSNTNPL